jgi:hypothetical protein
MAQVIFGIFAGLFGLILAAIVLTVVLVPLFKGIGWLIAHLFAFIGGEIRDALRLVGAIVTGVVFSLLVVANILIFRWSASAHYGRAFSAEVSAGAASVYRILIGHPARLLGLRSLVDGIENRVPQAVAAAPTKDKPSKRTGLFENYRIVGSLAGGGSGGKLYIAEPDDMKLAAFTRVGQNDVEQVVIKSFSLRDGSSLPQIVRESRSLDAAKKLGLVLDHELTPERFFYVMRYVPGESLGLVTQHLHAASPASGLSNAHLARALGFVDGLVGTLRRYHEGGLWHKDVKPDNIIVDGEQAHLVDFGLITPLRSAMTLTTHGTEYFRDPEMVRMALKGVKVHEVDGAKFDVYAAGAVLYSVVENSFPAHGGLSQITKRCPDALRWIVRRAMTEYDKRYPTAAAMLADLRYLRDAADPFAVKPAELPSMKGEEVPAEPVVEVRADEFAYEPPRRANYPRVSGLAGAARAAGAAAAASAAQTIARAKPRLRVTNWWSGKYRLADAPSREDAGGSAVFMAGIGEGKRPFAEFRRAGSARPQAPAGPGVRRPAAEQLQSARARAAERRAHAQGRIHHRRVSPAGRKHASGVNAGVAASVFIFLVFCVAVAGFLVTSSANRKVSAGASFALGDTGEERGAYAGAADGQAITVSETLVPPAPVAPVPALPRLDGRVMVVSDVTLAGNERAMSMVQSALAAMQQAGLRVSGTLRSLGLEGEALKTAQELEAKAQLVRATRPLESAAVGDDLAGWLADNEAADLLVWIEPPPAGSGQPGVYLFGTPEAMESTPPEFLASIQRMFAPEG